MFGLQESRVFELKGSKVFGLREVKGFRCKEFRLKEFRLKESKGLGCIRFRPEMC